MEGDDPELIAVYEVADTALLHQHRERIGETVLQALRATRAGAANFTMDRFTSWISWAAPPRPPARRRTPISLPDPRKARRVADDLLSTLRTTLSDPQRNPLLREIGPHFLVPPTLRHVDVQPVFDREARAFDHWLCRYAVTLSFRRRPAPRPLADPVASVARAAASPVVQASSAAGSAAPSDSGEVLGSTVEVRVDRDGRVVGYTSGVTPLTGRHILAPMAPPPAHGERSGHAHSGEAIVYLQDNFRMTRLLPYYLVQEGNHQGLYPACTHSLRVDILQRNSAGGASLGALIVGGSGSFRVEWFSWRPDTVLCDSGVTRHGEGLVIHVGPGMYTMTAVVHDLRFGTRVEFSKLVLVPIPMGALRD